MRTHFAIGTHEVCRYCKQDIQFEGGRVWIDRGGNRACVSYADHAGNLIKPRTKHAPFLHRESGRFELKEPD